MNKAVPTPEVFLASGETTSKPKKHNTISVIIEICAKVPIEGLSGEELERLP